MGRYDEPHFDVDDEKVVSVWASIVPWDDIPEDYWTPDYDGDDDDPWDRFSDDFGFGSYDLDFVESYFDDTKEAVPIGELVAPLSYGTSFRDAVTQRAGEIELEKTSYVFLIYNFKYDPTITHKDRSEYLRFVGVFPYTEDSG